MWRIERLTPWQHSYLINFKVYTLVFTALLCSMKCCIALYHWLNYGSENESKIYFILIQVLVWAAPRLIFSLSSGSFKHENKMCSIHQHIDENEHIH